MGIEKMRGVREEMGWRVERDDVVRKTPILCGIFVNSPPFYNAIFLPSITFTAGTVAGFSYRWNGSRGRWKNALSPLFLFSSFSPLPFLFPSFLFFPLFHGWRVHNQETTTTENERRVFSYLLYRDFTVKNQSGKMRTGISAGQWGSNIIIS